MPTPRYEREIRSLLNKLPNFLPETPSAPAGSRPQPRQGRRWWASQTWLLRDAYGMAALLVVLARFGQPLLGSAGAHLIAWIAVMLLVVAVVSAVARSFRQPQPPRAWRGKTLLYMPDPSHSGLLARLRRWLGSGPDRGTDFNGRRPR